MAILFTNNAKSKLASGINNVVTSLSVLTGEGAKFPSPTGGDYFMLTLEDGSGNIEIVKCTARSTDTLTVTRAQEGTSARSFSTNDKAELRMTAGSLSGFSQTDTLQKNTHLFATAAGSANALTATISSGLTALTDGMVFFIRATADSTSGTPTFDLTLGSTSTGALTIKDPDGDNLVAGDIQNGALLILEYRSSGTTWRLLNPQMGMGRQTIFMDAAGMVAGATNQPQRQDITISNAIMSVLSFDGAAAEYAHFKLAMPKSWDGGAIRFKPIWCHTSAATDDRVAWKFQAYSVADQESIGAAWPTAVTVTDGASTGGTANVLQIAGESGDVTPGGTPAGGETLFCRLFRDPADAGDVMSVDAHLIGLEIYYNTTTHRDN